MKCPRCQLGDLEPGMECPHCGFDVPDDASPDDAMLKELERVARAELEGQFDIERVLGRGGMSVVLLARESELKRYVAVKILPLQLTFAPDAAERFKREARMAASLEHPHIVPVHRVGATPRLMWYSMKYVRGATLAGVLSRQGTMSLDETARFVRKVGDALQYAHDKGIVHRDVKPGNFMIDERGWAWVADFGVAKAFGSVPLTQTGGALGTPGYMSPEQCYGRELDGRSDQYSLAVVAYECLAGSPPFVADSIGEYVHKHCHIPPPDIREVKGDIPDRVAEALLRGLSKKPEDRFDSVEEFAAALGAPRDSFTLTPVEPIEEIADKPTTPLTPTPIPSGSRGGRRLPGHASLALAAAVVLMLTLLILPNGAPEPLAPAAADSAAPQTPTAEPDGMGLLLISTAPVGRLEIDGRPAGESYRPEGVALRAGTRVLRVTREGYAPWVDTLTVAPGDTVRRILIALRSLQ